uniref:Cytosolic fatty-acid binding proteins domain-containing protein n=1 Tax=Cercocebus atys TaxID=9531 RepID=A0A2K5KHV8_CERAT
MATVQQLEGRWRLVDSKGFDEYMKELGEAPDLAAPQDCIITWKLKKPTADGRKTQTASCSFTDGALVQHQEWDGKESTITRKLKDGKLVVDCVMNNVTCTRIYEKVE